MAVSLEQFTQQLTASGLLTLAELQAFQASISVPRQPKSGDDLARELVRAGRLTKYQAAAVFQGKTKGLRFGEYVVLDRLGAGGMGVVYKALHRRMDREVAIKVLPTAAMKQQEAIDRFYREVKAAAKLSHPNIVAAYDAGEHEGMHYLVMEYVPGRDLAALVHHSGPLPVKEAVEYMLQAARGLAFAHEHGVVHRDIKPANLLLANEGTLKILDMGLARLRDDGLAGTDATAGRELTQSGQIMGTVDYMSPEQADDTRKADARADIYSLGCTLYRIITGECVFAGDSMMQKLMAHREKPIPSLVTALQTQSPGTAVPGFLSRVDAVFQKMLAKNPEHRQQSMGQVISELQAALAPPKAAAPPKRSGPNIATPPEPEVTANLNPFASLSAPSARAGVPASAGPSSPSVAVGVPASAGSSPPVGVPASAGSSSPPPVAREETVNRRKPESNTGDHLPAPSRTTTSTSLPKIPAANQTRLLLGLGGGVVALAVIGLLVAIFNGRSTPNVQPEPQPPGVVNTAPPPLAIAPFNETQAREHQEAWAKHLGVQVDFENSIGMKFVLIPPGEFVMGGSPAETEAALVAAGDNGLLQEWIRSESPRHRVILTKPFYLGVHEVTQAQYHKIMGQNPSHFASTSTVDSAKKAVAGLDTSSFPVEMVDWNDAVEFCVKASQQDKFLPCYSRVEEVVNPLAGNGYRLPTEAEWEFACRAGTTTYYWSGDRDEDMEAAGWSRKNGASRPHSVGELKANPFSLHDMHGNVVEWVQDGWEPSSYAPFQDKPAIDPIIPFRPDTNRMQRGGGYASSPINSRSGQRNYCGTKANHHDPGFRVALSIDAVKAAIAAVKTPPRAIAPFTAALAREHQAAWAKHLGVQVEFENSIGMKFRLIPPGEFDMGSPTNEEGRNNNETLHRVKLTRGFHLGVTEVTQGQWTTAMGTRPWSGKEGVNEGANHPATFVSWNDAQAFAKALSDKEGKTYRLPTEAEWEYACRAGTTLQFSSGYSEEQLTRAGWTVKNSGGGTHAVGELMANPFGLYDMHGNVWEWCEDWLGVYAGNATDPVGATTGMLRVVRGGSWLHSHDQARSSFRAGRTRTSVFNIDGFRVVLSIDTAKSAPGDSTDIEKTALVPNVPPQNAPPRSNAPFNETKAREHQEAWGKHLGINVETENSIGMKFRLIPPGEFMMGSTPEEMEAALQAAGNDQKSQEHIKSEGPRYSVTLTQPFVLGVHEVTQRQYLQVMGENPASFSATGDNKNAVKGLDTSAFPVENANWHETIAFCAKLSEVPAEKAAGRVYRLPTEAEWEFACRSGTPRKMSGSTAEQLNSVGWTQANAGNRTHAVGELAANPFGLYDMHGNVWEWCGDWHGTYPDSAVDPTGAASGTKRVLRGGSWFSGPEIARAAFRFGNTPGYRSTSSGFRVVYSLKTP